MTSSQILLIAGLPILALLALTGVGLARKKRESPRSKDLKQPLWNITFHDQTKVDRLIEFERDELKCKGRPPESGDGLMERAIYRWERDKAAASSLYGS